MSKPCLWNTVKPVLRGHSKNRQNKDFHDNCQLNEGRKYCRMLTLEHSVVRLTCIKKYIVLEPNVWYSL